MPDRLNPTAHRDDPNAGDSDLHVRLNALRPRIAFPPTPDVAGAVGRTIAVTRHGPTWNERPGRSAGRTSDRSWSRVAVVAAAVCVLLGAAAIIPAARETVADWFGVPGIRIVFNDDDAPATFPGGATDDASTPTANLGLLLGEPVSLEEARARVGFPVAIPDLPDLGPPDEIYVRERPEADQVAFLYRPRPGLPAVAETGIGLLLVQFEADDDAVWGVKKIVGGATETRVVPLGDGEALWLGGAHRLLVASDPLDGASGFPVGGTPDSRLTGNVLLWAENGITYRVESTLSLAETVRIAETTRALLDATPETPIP